MAHFAHIENGIVQQVIVVSNHDAPDPYPESEALGQAFIASLGLPGEWRQTSYHGTFRGNYAGIGYTYDADNDVFYAPQPFPSWTLDTNWQWQPPVPYPTDGMWTWDEETQQWEAVNG
jgi:hypothetical protein